MLTRSVEKPKALELIDQGHNAELVFRYDINEIEEENGGYEYEEIRMKTKNRQGLKELVEMDFETWLLDAQKANGIDLESVMASRIIEASTACQERIFAGFDSECLGESKHFDCAMTDQASIQGLALTALLGLNGLTTDETHWKATGELECYKFEYSQILQLATDLKKHIESNINQFNAERLAIINGD